MKQFRLLLLSVLALLGLGAGQSKAAQTVVDNYVYEFTQSLVKAQGMPFASSNTWTPAVGSTAPSAGKGWGLYRATGAASVTYGWTTTNYVPSAYTITGSTANGAIYVSGTTTNTDNLIVTPAVKGTVSFWARKYGTSTAAAYASDHIKLYAMTRTEAADGTVTYTKVSETPLKTVNLTSTAFVQQTLNVSDYTYIGIAMKYCYIDFFQATSAKVDANLVTSASLTYANWANTNPPTSYSPAYDDIDADGYVNVKFLGTVTNTGDFDIKNKQAYLVAYHSDDFMTPYEEIPITLNIKAGGTQAIGTSSAPLITKYKYEDHPENAGIQMQLKLDGEIVGATSSFSATRVTNPVPYGPQLAITVSAGSVRTTINKIHTLPFQPSQTAKTMTLQLTNSGNVPVTFSNISVPEGFTTTLSTSTKVAAHASTNITITSNATLGHKEGVLSFDSNDGSYQITLVSDIVSGYCQTFESGIGGDMMRESAGWASTVHYYRYENDNIYTAAHTGMTDDKLITPLLNVQTGDQLSFEVSRMALTGVTVGEEVDIPEASAKVWYSRDRKNWTLAKTISNSELPTDYNVYLATSTATTESHYFKYKAFTIEGLPAGQYYIAFSGSQIFLDNIYGKTGYNTVAVDHDLAVSSYTIPASSAINTPYKASIGITNLKIGKTEAAGSYTARLYFGDEAVAEAEAVQIAGAYASSNSQTKFYFNYSPRTVGTYQARIELAFSDGYVVKTDNVAVTVAEESGQFEMQVGESNTTNMNVIANNEQTEIEAVYTPEDLKIQSGTKINGITWRGIIGSGTMGNMTPSVYHVRVYIEHTQDNAYQRPFAMADTTKMRKILDLPNYTYTPMQGGSTGNAIVNGVQRYGVVTDAIDLISVHFQQPFIYQGANLRVAIYSERLQPGGTTPTFEADLTASNYCIARNYNAAYSSTPLNTANRPVMHIAVDKASSNVLGKVTNAETGAPIEGINVKLESNESDIFYEQATDSEGNYSFDVFHDQQEYHLSINNVGYYKYAEDFFVDSRKVKNIALTAATGISIVDGTVNIPATGEANSAITATVEGENFTAATIAASDYTAKLYVNDEAVATAQSITVASEGKADYQFSYIPSAVGQYKAYIAFEHNNGTINKSSIFDIDVAEEKLSLLKAVPDSTGRTTIVGLYPYMREAAIETIYTTDQLLAGDVKAGDIIKNLTFRGYSSQAATQYPVRVYIEETDDTAPTFTNSTTYTVRDTTQMTCVYDGVITTKNSGSVNVDMYSFDFANGGFVYGGKNLRVVVVTNGTVTRAVYLNYNNNNTHAIYAYRYSTTSTAMDRVYRGQQAVGYFTVDRYHTLTGKVEARDEMAGSDAKAPVEGVEVTLKSGSIEYHATTDSEGKYTILVGKFNENYNIIFSKEGYTTQTFNNISLADGDLEVNAEFMLNVDYRNITGTVTDTRNAILQGVKVELAYGDEETYTHYTDQQGKYTFTIDKFEKPYTLTYTLDGYEKLEKSVQWQYGTTTVVDAQLQAISNRRYTGTVTDAETGEPVSGAVVKLSVDGSTVYSATTRTNGAFTITVAQYKQDYDVTVEANGYESLSAGTVNLTEGNLSADFALNKIASFQLYGYVVGKADGKPIEGVSVAARSGETEVKAVTDASGSYSMTIEDYSADYEVEFTLMDYITVSKTVSFANADAKLNVALEKIPFRTVSGTITEKGSEGTPISGATVTLTSGDVVLQATTDAEGKYSVDVEQYDLAYEVTFAAEDYEPATVELTFFGEDVTLNQELQKIAYRTVSGTVTDKETKAALEGVNITFTSGNVVLTATTDADGKYSLDIEQYKLTYSVAFEKEGYEKSVASLSLTDGDRILNVELEKVVVNSIEALRASGDDVQVFTLQGTPVSKQSLRKGLYIVNGKKTVVK